MVLSGVRGTFLHRDHRRRRTDYGAQPSLFRQYEEISRVPSPDGAYEAVLVEWDPSDRFYAELPLPCTTGTPFEAEKGGSNMRSLRLRGQYAEHYMTGPRDLMIRYANDVIRLYENCGLISRWGVSAQAYGRHLYRFTIRLRLAVLRRFAMRTGGVAGSFYIQRTRMSR